MCSELPGLDLSYIVILSVAKFEGEVKVRLIGTFEVVFDRFLG